MYMKKNLVIILAMSLALVGCSGKSQNSAVVQESIGMNSMSMSASDSIAGGASFDVGFNGYTEDYNYKAEGIELDSIETESVKESVTNNRSSSIVDNINQEKLVYIADLRVETLDFDEAQKAIREKIDQYKGIIEDEQFYDGGYWDHYEGYRVSGERNVSITIRIPTEKYSQFMNEVNTIGNIVNARARVENISQQYYNSKAYLESYQNQLSVLQGMYNRAKTIEEMLQIEARISNVQAEILKLTTEIQSMDMDVAYSTINLQLSEVVKYSENPGVGDQRTFLDRLILECKDSWDSFLYFLESALFWFISSIWKIAIILGLVWVYMKFFRAKVKNRLKRDKKSSKSIKINKLIKTKANESNEQNEENKGNSNKEI